MGKRSIVPATCGDESDRFPGLLCPLPWIVPAFRDVLSRYNLPIAQLSLSSFALTKPQTAKYVSFDDPQVRSRGFGRPILG